MSSPGKSNGLGGVLRSADCIEAATGLWGGSEFAGEANPPLPSEHVGVKKNESLIGLISHGAGLPNGLLGDQ